MRKLAMWEYVFINELTAAVWHLPISHVGRGNAMVHYDAILCKERIYLLEVGGQMFQSDMFEHAYAGDAVEPARNIAIILQPDFYLAIQPGPVYPLFSQVKLVFR